MKRLLLIVLFISVGFSQKEYDINHIVEVNGVYYKKFSDEIVNGKVFDGDFNAPLGTMKEGKKDGKWIIWNDDGTKEREESYKDGEKIESEDWNIGRETKFWLMLDPDSFGSLKKIEYKKYLAIKGIKEYDINHIVKYVDELYVEKKGLYIKKFSDFEIVNGKVFRMYGVHKAPLGMIKNGMKEGIWIIWYDLGWNDEGTRDKEETYNHYGELIKETTYKNGIKYSEYTFKDGEKDGLFTEWWKNGQKSEQGKFKNGEKDGLWSEWYRNGQKENERTYKDGKEDGLTTSWYENGQKKFETTYKEGQEDGLWTRWYENGQKEIERTYKDGKQDGKWTEWYESGQKRNQLTYKDGELISKKCWDEDGNDCECSRRWWEGCK